MATSETATACLTTDHAELIKSLHAASNHLANAAYFLEHPEIHSDDAKTLSSVYYRAKAGLSVADYFVREQIEALRPAEEASTS
ncbi:MAG: hypothetical protein JWP85_2151 [Rhodoglobus sp.]|nr:hypothetical protein [Rhodoglobus sp.]